MTGLITPMTGSVISSPDTQAAIWFLGALSQVRLSGEQTGGAFSLADTLARRGNASPVHVHDRDDETFFVLDGELRVFAGEDDYTAGPGTGRGPATAPSPRLRGHLRQSAVPRAARPGRLRAVRRRGRPARPGPHPAPTARRATRPRRAGSDSRPARHHHPGPAAPALDVRARHSPWRLAPRGTAGATVPGSGRRFRRR